MKYKVSELEGAPLDAAVAKSEGCLAPSPGTESGEWLTGQNLAYSSDWAAGGPIIERERIDVMFRSGRKHPAHNEGPDYWWANMPDNRGKSGPLPLVAAMRAYVHSKFGEEIEL